MIAEDSESVSSGSTLLSMLTIVIPTFGRPGRAMTKARYWAEQGCAIHVMDGSASRDSHADANDNSRVFYHHRPGSTMASRIAQGGDLVETPYVMLQPDDDVFLSGALESIITSLENDPTAVAASGVALRLQPSGYGRYLLKVAYPQMLDRARNAGQSGKNLTDFMRNYYMSALWGVVRADVFKIVAHNLGSLETGPYAIEELFFEMGVNGVGRVLALPEVYWVRNPGVPSVDLFISRPQAEQDRPWFLNPKSVEYKSFVKQMAKVFDSSGVVENFAGSEAAIQGVESYSVFFLSRNSSVTSKSAKRKRNPLAVMRIPALMRLRSTLSFLQNWVLSVTLSSKRRLEEAFPQPPLTFFREAEKAGVKLDKSSFLRAVKSMR
jgi:glycosyltransferase domain-containing protein